MSSNDYDCHGDCVINDDGLSDRWDSCGVCGGVNISCAGVDGTFYWMYNGAITNISCGD